MQYSLTLSFEKPSPRKRERLPRLSMQHQFLQGDLLSSQETQDKQGLSDSRILCCFPRVAVALGIWKYVGDDDDGICSESPPSMVPAS